MFLNLLENSYKAKSFVLALIAKHVIALSAFYNKPFIKGITSKLLYNANIYTVRKSNCYNEDSGR